MNTRILLGIATFLASAHALTKAVVQTDVLSADVNVQATVYDDETTIYTSGTYTSGTATGAAAPADITSYRNAFATGAQGKVVIISSDTTTVAPANTVVQKAGSVATTSNTQAQATAATANTTAANTATASTASAAAAASSSSSSFPPSNLNSFQSTMLSEHNKKRALHKGVGPLTWNSTLAAYAQAYADKYSCPSNGALTHSGGPYGENLASGYSDQGTVDTWYDEIKQYSYSSPGFSEATGHFTQLIWKSSHQVGCAYKSCNDEWGNYVVCEYYPMGNVVLAGGMSYWSLNVPPLK